MKQLLLSLALYRQWANKVLLKKLSTLPSEILQRETGTSFGNINQTLTHVLNANSIWWQRIQLKEKIELPGIELTNDFNSLSKEILFMSELWVSLISEASELRLQHVFEYRNSKREAFKQPLYDVLLHLFNHETYHHGQVVAMLKILQIENIPATDYIVFTRTKGKIN